jgi:chitin synthase
VAAFVLAFKGIEGVQQELGRPLNGGDVITNPIFRNVILSLAATLGLYLVASLIFVSFLSLSYLFSLLTLPTSSSPGT